MSEFTSLPMTKIDQRAAEGHRNEMLLNSHNAAWAGLSEEDPEAVDKFTAERGTWVSTIADEMKQNHAFARRREVC